MDRHAIYLGALSQLVVFAILFLTVPLKMTLGSFVVGGLVAGWYSDTFEEEYLDGAAASPLGLCLSLAVVVTNNWLALPTSILRYKVDYALLTTLHTAPLLILAIPIAGVVGAVTANVSATLARVYGRPAV